MLNKENIDFILSNNSYSDIQNKRLRKELNLLSNYEDNNNKLALITTSTGLIVKIEAKNNLFYKNTEIKNQIIIFHLIIDSKYPFSIPKLYCISKFCEPSLADGRDYIPNVLKNPWNPSLLLIDIIHKLPSFLDEIITNLNTDDKFYLQNIGSYYLGQSYDLNDFISYQNISIFPAYEYLTLEKNVFRYLVVSEAHFLTFESFVNENKENQSSVTLVSWAPLFALLKLTRKKRKGNSTIILSWHDYKKKQGMLQILSLNEEGRFVESLLKNMKKYDIHIQKNIHKKPDLTIDDVTVNVFKNLDKETLFKTINDFEKKSINNLDSETIDSLSRLYQKVLKIIFIYLIIKAIEYFSALNDSNYTTYLDKLHNFLTRNDVILFLKQHEKKFDNEIKDLECNISIKDDIKLENERLLENK